MTNNTTNNNTKTNLEKLMQKRNTFLKNGFDLCDLEEINTELIQTISQIAAFKTLKFLAFNNATISTETDTEQKTSFGYNMSVELLKSLYFDIEKLRNATNENEAIQDVFITENLSDAIDLVQVASETIIPFICSTAQLKLTDTVYTKVLKNGNEKNYTLFSLACKAIREYITKQQQTRQYKKLAYVIGYTDNGTEITTTKRPKNDISDTDTETKQNFLNKYKLTEQEQTAILHLFDGLTTTETAEKMQVSKRTIERALKSAKEKILTKDKRIQL